MTTAEKMVKLRGKRPQKEVAKSVGISVSALSMYECGERNPRDEVKARIARYYGVSIQELFYSELDHVS